MENFTECNQPKEIKDALKGLIRNRSGIVVLSGTNGTGKTYAAKCVYNCISPFSLPFYDSDVALFYNQADLNMEWTKHQNEYGETYSLLEKLKKVELLILDDIGTRTPTSAFNDFLYSLIDYRRHEKKMTIITTNLTSEDIRKQFGDAFLSRIASGKCFRIDGQDRRFKNGI